jgi:aspartate/methionine/tyrosine aminotransferase
MKILDFGWGDTRGVRDVLLEVYQNLTLIQHMPLRKFGYPSYEGDPDLIKMLKNLTKKLTDLNYEYICVTAGCTHALNASIYAMNMDRTETLFTRSMYYPRYPELARMAGLYHHRDEIKTFREEDIFLVDSPSNPLGLLGPLNKTNPNRTIWDAAYHTPTYGIALPGLHNIDAAVFCGSVSKLTGMNGIRLGWTATNDAELHDKIKNYVKNDTCGVSYPSQWIAMDILSSERMLEEFFKYSATMVEYNKEEVLKLKNILGSDRMPTHGMFAFYEVDDSLLSLFDKACVKFTNGQDCGAKVKSIRINLGNSNMQTREMVERIKNADSKSGRI